MGEDLIKKFDLSKEYEKNKKYYNRIYGNDFYYKNAGYGFNMPVWEVEETAFITTLTKFFNK
jgi:hypothetical protein